MPYGQIFKKRIDVYAPKPPQLFSQTIFEKPLAAKEPIKIELSSADKIYDYRLSSNDQTSNCLEQLNVLSCDITPLKLIQSTKYDIKLERLFKGKPVGVVFDRSITTVEPLVITRTSVANNETIYNIPTEITATFSKPIKTFTAKLEQINGDKRTLIVAKAKIQNSSLVFELSKPLERSTSFVLTIDDALTSDGSYLVKPAVINFQTSGGPKVTDINIGSYKVSVETSPNITFDTAPNPNQNLSDYIRVESAGKQIGATFTRNGKTINIKFLSVLPRCTSFSIKVLDGLENESGISGGSAWQFNSRTICQTIFSIGTSVQGRSITGYSFGTGPSKILFVGTTHGNEKSSTYLLNKWIDVLESSPDRIPANRTIIVVPNINPDGFAANQRTNSHNVDLNRNFPSNDWKSGVIMPDKTYLEHGGGITPLSEPESQAIANYVTAIKPRLVLTYHASGAVVSPNDSGDSQSIAHTYDQKSNVGYLANDATSNFFNYDTTGAFESWLHDKLNIPTLLIELVTKTSNSEYSGHQNALWYIAQLP